MTQGRSTPDPTPTPDLITDVGVHDFQRLVLDASRERPVLVDFWADWCGPCRMLTPHLEEVVARRSGDVALAKIDTEAEPALARRFGITGIPHVKLFHAGREVGHFVGARGAAAIEQFLDEHLAPSAFERLLDVHRADEVFGDAVAAFELGMVEQGLHHLLELVQRGDAHAADAREFLLAAFDHHGTQHPSVIRYRKQLATVLF